MSEAIDTIDTIASIIAAKEGKEGNTEFLLTRYADGEWQAAIGNRSEHVAIGEAILYGDKEVDYCASGPTPKEALENLLAKMSSL